MPDEGFKHKFTSNLNADTKSFLCRIDEDVLKTILFSTMVCSQQIVGGCKNEMPRMSI